MDKVGWKYILGGGIAGLIYAFYNKDYKVISDTFGGQMVTDMGPRYIEANDITRGFLADVGIEIESLPAKEIRVGYYDNDVKEVVNQPPEHFRNAYWRITRGNIPIENSCMNSNKKSMIVFDIDASIVMDKLIEYFSLSKRIIVEEVCKVNLRRKMIETIGGGEFKFSKMISTLPLPILHKMICPAELREFKSTVFYYAPTTFLFVRPNEFLYNMFSEGSDFVYVINHKFMHRVTKISNSLYCLEMTVDEFTNFSRCNLNEFVPVGKSVLKVGQILSAEYTVFSKTLDKYNIELFGRYAEWNHGIRTTQLIEKAKEKANG